MSTSAEQLKRTIRWLQVYGALMTVALAVLFVRSGTPADGVLRARGLIIEDEAGRERILIGAPVPEAANRVRTDEARVQEVWASRYPDADGYMGYYQGYSHETNGLLILSEDGFDRLVLGDPVPDPNIGRRIAPSTGMVINDLEGFERMGYGFKVVNGLGRVGFGSRHGSYPGGSAFDPGRRRAARRHSGYWGERDLPWQRARRSRVDRPCGGVSGATGQARRRDRPPGECRKAQVKPPA